MKKNKYELIKGIIGILLCVTSVAGIYYWESYGREEYVKEEIVVLKNIRETIDGHYGQGPNSG